MSLGTVWRSCTSPQPFSWAAGAQRTSSKGTSRSIGLANAPAIRCSPSDSTGASAGEPHARHV